MRDIYQLHPELQRKIQMLVASCEKNGLKIGIGECVRTVAEQDALYAQGRTKAGKKVTNAKGSTYSSMHQWYVAFDFYRNDGKGAYYDNDGFFTKVGKIGVTLGLEWGGNWKNPVDKPHFQLPNWGSTTAQLKKLYGTPEKFKMSWGAPLPTQKNNLVLAKATVKKGSSGTNAKYLQADLNYTMGTNLELDGKFGAKSVEVLKKWQAKNGLVADGIYGAKGYAKMKSLLGL